MDNHICPLCNGTGQFKKRQYYFLLTPRNTIEFDEKLIHATKKSETTQEMISCDHAYHCVEKTGLKNGHGCPTWACVYCKHRVISM